MSISDNTISLQDILDAVNNLPEAGEGGGGTVLPTLADPAEAEEVFLGKETIAQDGSVQTGTFTIDSELADQSALIAQIISVLQGKAAGGGALDGYSRCDYIQFSGTQLIDTGVIGNQDTEINVCFARSTSNQRYLFGCASSDNTAGITAYMAGTWRFGNKNASKALGTINGRISYGALVNKSTISVAGAVANISEVNDFETIGTLLLGGCRGSSGALPTTLFDGRVYYFIVRQGGEQVLKLVPVTDGNGVYRFWDEVSETFFDSVTDVALEGGNL